MSEPTTSTACDACESVYGHGHVEAPCYHQRALLVHDERYEDLHYDEIPILFTGFNAIGGRIIGSSVEETGEKARYFHAEVTTEVYDAFRRGEVSWRGILESAPFWIVDKAWGGDRAWLQRATALSIEAAYLPLAESFCPMP